jgi:hypothetical protein
MSHGFNLVKAWSGENDSLTFQNNATCSHLYSKMEAEYAASVTQFPSATMRPLECPNTCQTARFYNLQSGFWILPVNNNSASAKISGLPCGYHEGPLFPWAPLSSTLQRGPPFPGPSLKVPFWTSVIDLKKTAVPLVNQMPQTEAFCQCMTPEVAQTRFTTIEFCKFSKEQLDLASSAIKT